MAVCVVVVLRKWRYYFSLKDDWITNNYSKWRQYRADFVKNYKTHIEVNRLDREKEPNQERNLPDLKVLIEQRNFSEENEWNLLQILSIHFSHFCQQFP